MFPHRGPRITTTEVNSLISATPGRGMAAHSRKNPWYEGTEVARPLSYLVGTSTQKSPHVTLFHGLCSNSRGDLGAMPILKGILTHN